MSTRHLFAAGLANAMLGGRWETAPMLERCVAAAGASGHWLRSLVAAVLKQFPEPPHASRGLLTAFVVDRRELVVVRRARQGFPRIRSWRGTAPKMSEHRWNVRRLDTLGDVERWLSLSGSDLAWFADRKGLERTAKDPRLQNYNYRWLGTRLVEAPKQRLKEIQRKVLHDVLDAIEPHDAAHAFRRGRSVLTHARLHAACETVIRFDLRAFFNHVPTPRAFGIFRAAGYPEEVARTLIAICTNATPWKVAVRAPFELRERLLEDHLPQGAPTSPALANLVARSLDVRLAGLGRTFGAQYSRYADDLTFSGDRSLAAGADRLEHAVAEISASEGFVLNRGKTRKMTSSRRQWVTGAVVNAGVNVPRDEYDRLKATLHNCLRHGLEAESRGVENFRAHLEGKVGWVESLNPSRGAKLRAMLNALK
ncbi:MAG: reverse transcriptase family protein [Myxococcaceae bacterium]